MIRETKSRSWVFRFLRRRRDEAIVASIASATLIVAAVAGEFGSALGSVATAAGVWFAYSALNKSVQQAKSDFEDRLWHEYRQIAQHIPVGALLGKALEEKCQEESLQWFFADISTCPIRRDSSGQYQAEDVISDLFNNVIPKLV